MNNNFPTGILQGLTNPTEANKAHITELRSLFEFRALAAKKNTDLIREIVEKQIARVRQDIASWRSGISLAENPERPKRIKLYQTYKDVELDNHLSGLVEHALIDRIMAEEYRITDASGVIDEELTKLFAGLWFRKFVKETVKSEFWGHSLMQIVANQLNGKNSIEVQLMPRENVRPEFGDILKNYTDDKGFLYRDTPLMNFLVEVGEHKNLGVYMKAAKSTIFKKNAEMAWSEFGEKFGMPLTIAKTNTRDKNQMDLMDEAIRSFGSAAYAIIGMEDELELAETKRGDAFQVYDKMIDRQNSELSKLVLGNTLTTDTGKSGTRAQGEVHERVSDDVIFSLKTLVASVVNDQLLYVLSQQGLKTEGREFQFVTHKDIDGMFNRVIQILPFYDIDDSYIEDNFGIPVIARRETGNQNDDPAKKK